MIAALLVVVACAGNGACNSYEPQTWYAPTAEELETCATMADDLILLGKRASCQVVPMAEEEAKKTSFATPEKAHRIRFTYQGDKPRNVEAAISFILPAGYVF